MSAAAEVGWPDIRLTPIEAGDLDRLHAWQNDPAIRDLIMGFRGPVRRETTAEWIAAVVDQNLKTRTVFAIRGAAGLLGTVQLHAIDWVHRTAMLGIHVGVEQARGAGVGRAATALILDYGFAGLDLRRIALEVLASNSPAARLYEGLGFRREGVLRQAFLRNGVHEDVWLYGLLKAEFAVALPPEARRLVSSR